jgi:hypothetical protein
MVKTTGYLIGFSLISLMISGVFIQQDRKITQNLIVEFENAGLFEVTMTQRGVTNSITRFGYYLVISRYIDMPWDVSFVARMLEYDPSPLYVKVKTMDGEIIHRTVLVDKDSTLIINCIRLCSTSP